MIRGLGDAQASWETPGVEMEQTAEGTAGIWGIYLQPQGRGLSLQLSGCIVHQRYETSHSFQNTFLQAPHVIHMRAGVKMGEASLQDTIIFDGLTDAFYQYHMGITGKR